MKENYNVVNHEWFKKEFKKLGYNKFEYSKRGSYMKATKTKSGIIFYLIECGIATNKINKHGDKVKLTEKEKHIRGTFTSYCVCSEMNGEYK